MGDAILTQNEKMFKEFSELQQDIFADIEALMALIKKIGDWNGATQKELQDAQWFLGEEKSRRETLERELESRKNILADRETELQDLKVRLNESQWYLGEERSRCLCLEDALKGYEHKTQELESQLSSAMARNADLEREYSNAQWYLGEERAKREQLENALKETHQVRK